MATLAALLPKCILCLWAWAAVATGLQVAGRELCGGSGPDSGTPWSLAGLAVIVVAVAAFAREKISALRRPGEAGKAGAPSCRLRENQQ